MNQQRLAYTCGGDKQRYCDITLYPNKYAQTYWGRFPYNAQSDTDILEAVKNRNVFITDYNINKKARLPKYINDKLDRKNDFYDHVECYKTSDRSYVIITSPSHRSDKTYFDSYAEEHGWTKIYDLYSDSTHTFIKIFKMKYAR